MLCITPYKELRAGDKSIYDYIKDGDTVNEKVIAYRGVIDDEEFTAYLYPTEPDLWEILEDPTGMAYRTLYENGEGRVTKEAHEDFMNQVAKMLENTEV